jgi:hypothetical protein
MRALCLALCAGGARAWVTKSQSNFGAQIGEIQAQMNGDKVYGEDELPRDPQMQLGYLWHSPMDPEDTRGLGGGITWAWNPDLCGPLLSKFREDIFGYPGGFVNCDDMRAAIARALDKWSANNRFIKFLDITDECKQAGLLYGPPLADFQEGGFRHGGCPLAEVWITMMHPDESIGSNAVASAMPYAHYATDFRYTNGARPFYNDNNPDKPCPTEECKYRRPVVEADSGIFSYNTNSVCWYMDTEFCSGIHDLKRQMGGASNAKTFVSGLSYGLMVLGILFYGCLTVSVFIRVTGDITGLGTDDDGDGQLDDDEDGDGQLSCKERLFAALRIISHWNPLILATFIALLIVPPLMVTKVFNPCFECFDFEAAALHELGHFLGLGHPDNIPQNYYGPVDAGGSGAIPQAGPIAGKNSYQVQMSEAMAAGVRPNSSVVCVNPWQGVMAGVPAATDEVVIGSEVFIGPGGYPVRESQMWAFTENNPQPCLRNDDVEALSVLYPDCSPFALSTNVCHTVARNIGYVRIAVYVLIPFIMALLLVVTCSSVVHVFERREKERMEQKMKELLKEKAMHKSDVLEAKAAAKFSMYAAKAKLAKAEAKVAKASASSTGMHEIEIQP